MPRKQPRPFHDYFVEHAAELRRWFVWKVGEEEADDLTQQVYLRALESAEPASLRDPKAFLFRIASNLAIDTYRRRRIRANHTAEALPELDDIPAEAPGPEQTALGRLELQRFRQALAELPEITRHAFLLNRLDGLSYPEVANRLGISRKSVERHIQKALRHCLERMAG